MTLWLSLVAGITLLMTLVAAWLRRSRPQVVAPLTAAVVSAQTLAWLFLPTSASWMFPGWDALRWSVTRPAWLTGLALGLALSGAAWHGVAKERPEHRSPVELFIFPLLGLALLAQDAVTLLVLSAWLDLVWLAEMARQGVSAERLSGGLLLRGAALLALWLGSLSGGVQAAWWWGAAALLRLAPFPFTLERRTDVPLFTALFNPLIAARLLSGVPQGLPMGMAGWVAFAALAVALRAWLGVEEECRARVGEALLLAGMSAGLLRAGSPLPLLVAGTWAAAWLLWNVGYAWSRAAWFWVVPGAWGLAVLIGLPPAPMGLALWTALSHSPWLVLVVLMGALVLALAAGVEALRRPLEDSPLAPERWQQVAQGAGLVLLMVGTVVGALGAGEVTLAVPGLVAWTVALAAGAALALWGAKAGARWRAPQRWELVTDAGVLGRWLERGAQAVLYGVNFLAGVIEGDGALIWSMVLLFLMLVAGRMG